MLRSHRLNCIGASCTNITRARYVLLRPEVIRGSLLEHLEPMATTHMDHAPVESGVVVVLLLATELLHEGHLHGADVHVVGLVRPSGRHQLPNLITLLKKKKLETSFSFIGAKSHQTTIRH